MRTKPYTEIGIKRLKCFRCKNKASTQWNICSDGPYRPLCWECDVELNEIVLEWAGFTDWKEKALLYDCKMARKYGKRYDTVKELMDDILDK